MITPGRPVVVIANSLIIPASRLTVRGGQLADRLAHSVARPLEVVNP